MPASEINFDGLVGPTHNYAGLAFGNVASLRNKGRRSNPRAAALQGLAKMKLLADMGIAQAVLPPHPRPDVTALRRLGFGGSDANILETAAREAPQLLAACCSASAMWTANAATISPSADARDGRVHLTPANLVSQFHRSLETATTARVLRAIFHDESLFAHHPPLPAAKLLADEGAANHMRLAATHRSRGVEIFVHGPDAPAKKYPARQTREASQCIARAHGVQENAVFLEQNPAAIDAGAFHNDVLAVANLNVLFYHSQAWEGVPALKRAMAGRGGELVEIRVRPKQVSLRDAISSYLFNSQIVSLADGTMALIAPLECRRTPSVRRFLKSLAGGETPIKSVHFVEVRQSMCNGGGPACLRLRVVLSERERAAVHGGIFFTPTLYHSLTGWITRHYRQSLTPADLADVQLVEEGRRALDELSGILGLGSIYDFQRG